MFATFFPRNSPARGSFDPSLPQQGFLFSTEYWHILSSARSGEVVYPQWSLMIECYLRTDAFIPKQSLFPSRKILFFSQSRILVKNFFYSPVVSLLWNFLFKGLFPQQKRFVWGFSFPQRTCFMEISWLRIFMPSEELIYWKCSSKNSPFPSRVWSWLRIFIFSRKVYCMTSYSRILISPKSLFLLISSLFPSGVAISKLSCKDSRIPNRNIILRFPMQRLPHSLQEFCA